VNPFKTIERKDVGLSLRVRPQISEGGTVKMAIYQESSSVFSTGDDGITTNKRSIDTNVLVDDGQIIVLGGLIDDSTQDSVVKVPGLGDIPILGNLFKYQKRIRKKTNLMVFLRPTVIRNNEQSVNLSSDRYDFIRNAEIAGQPEKKLVLPDMGAPLLPPLENGRITGGPLVDQTGGSQTGVNPAEPGSPENPQPPLTQEPSPQAAPLPEPATPGN
ncbi:MAG: type II secretion system protein GspD, partial [Gallionella sp.]|nr:type II secretion system protein GspD [Gallionella sp.]